MTIQNPAPIRTGEGQIVPSSPVELGGNGQVRFLVLLKLAIVLPSLLFAYYIAWKYRDVFEGTYAAFPFWVIPVYISLAYWVQIDPKKYSQRWFNFGSPRFGANDAWLIFLAVWPGRFAAITLIEGWFLIRHAFDKAPADPI